MPDLPKRKLGRTGLNVTVLGFGALELRGMVAGVGRPLRPGQPESILNAVLDAGINYIDMDLPIEPHLLKPIPRWDMHFGGLEDDRKYSTAPHITLRPQLGAHRQCGLAICTFHLGFSLGVWLGDGSRDAPLVHCDHNDEPHYQRIAQAAGESWRILGISEQTFYR